MNNTASIVLCLLLALSVVVIGFLSMSNNDNKQKVGCIYWIIYLVVILILIIFFSN